MRAPHIMFALFASISTISAAHAASSPWYVTKSEWTEADEKGFGDFVRQIAESGCSTTMECIAGEGNPYRRSDPQALKFIADCADFPYMLRAYYAWKNGLPFAYIDAVSGTAADIRFESKGNTIISRRQLVDHGGAGLPAISILTAIHMTVSSATYRTDPADTGKMMSDFYSPKIQPDSIHAGTVLYDTNGHVAIVYAVDPDGRLRYLDADPDHTVSRAVYGPQFAQSPSRLGGGFKNFRPMKLEGAKLANGRYIGGHIVLAGNEAVADYSLEQYRGTADEADGDGPDAIFQYENTPVGLFEYVRGAMSGGTYQFDPVYELKVGMESVCNQLQERAHYVQVAVESGIDKKAQPATLPGNIYATDNEEWESYSTPSRDARLKNSVAQLYVDLMKLIMFVERRDSMTYAGSDLQREMEQTYVQKAKDCSVSYTKSDGSEVRFDFDGALARFFTMSFDPYQCIEHRWGATDEKELASCRDDALKTRWYDAEQRFRNQAERTYSARDHFTLADLEKEDRSTGAKTPPPTDIKGLLAQFGRQPLLAQMDPVGF